MTLPFTWVSIALGGFVAIGILILVRRNHLVVSHAVWWLFVAGCSVLIGVFPRLMDWIAERIGVHYPPIFIVAVVVAGMLIKMLTMDLQLAVNERKIRSLAQRIAILEHELRKARGVGVDREEP
ncbi:DUF2304 domain-containing protein [Desulfatirhabdium butyrativorans]|uniref:DUF2304 domain-containing protein n=1 Tax=Desulfatirhabdium butyrativorans TaxID=340467 RepID=UPI000412EB3B|nr:DUF2304 domain-containing protein [Desulfatirhabdium butyrativorans]